MVDVIPDVVKNLSDTAKALLKNPIRFVLAVIIAMLLTLFETVADIMAEIILFARTPAAFVGNVFRQLSDSVASGVFGLISTFNQTIVLAVGATGPAAPIALVALYGAELWVLWQLIIVASQIPVLNEISNVVRRVVPWT